MMTKCIFFDFGGTLVDMSISHKALCFGLKNVLSNKLFTDGLISKWENESRIIFEHYYKKREFHAVKRLQVIGLKNVLSEYNVDLADHKLFSIINEFWCYFIKNCRLYDDVIPTLSQLNQEYELGLITDGDEENVISILKKRNLDKMFKLKVISSVFRNYKPNLLLFEKALELAKCLPEETVYVGDSVKDVYGAKKLGLITVIINRDKAQDPMMKIETDFIINSLFQLPSLIKNISEES